MRPWHFPQGTIAPPPWLAWQRAAHLAALQCNLLLPPPPPPPPLSPAGSSEHSNGSDESQSSAASGTEDEEEEEEIAPTAAVACPLSPTSQSADSRLEELRKRLAASPLFRDATRRHRRLRRDTASVKAEPDGNDTDVALRESQVERRAASGHATLAQVVDRCWVAPRPKPSMKAGLSAAPKSRRRRGGRGGRRRKDAKPSTKTVASSMVIPKWTKAARKGVNPSTKEPRVLTKGKGKGVHPSPTVKALPMKKHKEKDVSSDMDVAGRSRRQLKRQRPSPATVRKRIQALREVTVTVAVRRHR